MEFFQEIVSVCEAQTPVAQCFQNVRVVFGVHCLVRVVGGQIVEVVHVFLDDKNDSAQYRIGGRGQIQRVAKLRVVCLGWLVHSGEGEL